MDRRLTIGLVTPAWPGSETPNGIATAVRQLASGLRTAGHGPVIIPFTEDTSPPGDMPVFPVIRRPWSLQQKIAARLGRRADVVATAIGDDIAAAVEAAHAALGLDAVLVEETQGWAHRIARRGRVPVIVVLHGPWLLHASIQDDGSEANRGRALREARAFVSARGILAPSRNVLDAVNAAVDLGNKPRAVIPNALGPDAPSGAAVSALQSGGPVLFVGRFDLHKGGDTVIEAFARVHAARPDARLTFVGPDRGVRQPDGSYLSLDAALAALPAETRAAVAAPGRRGAGEVAALRRTHPIGVIASRYENFNYTMLEAMATGQAIVSTAVGGPAEALRHEETALLVPPGNPAAMAAAILRLIGDPALARRLGEAAAADLAARFAPETIARQTADFISGRLETPR